jgi:hypothetical protein
LNLGKLDTWKNILPGTMHLLAWKGEDLDGTDGTRSDDDDDNDQDNNDEEDDDDSSDDGDDETNIPQKAGGGSEATLTLSDANRIPLPGEALKDFYSRTTEYWNQEVANTGVNLNEKQIKNESFKLAKQKYDEINVSADTTDNGDDDGEKQHSSKKDKDNKNRIKRRGV